MSEEIPSFDSIEVVALYNNQNIAVQIQVYHTDFNALHKVDVGETPYYKQFTPRLYNIFAPRAINLEGEIKVIQGENSATVLLPQYREPFVWIIEYGDAPPEEPYEPPPEVPEEEETTPTPTPPETVEVPSGYGWLEPVLNAFYGVFDGISAAIDGLKDSFADIGSDISGAIFGFIANLTEGLTQPLNQVGVSAMDEMITATSEHSPDPELLAKATQLIQQLQDKQNKIIGEIHQSPANPDEAPEASNALATGLLVAGLSVETAGALLDLVHPIKNINATEISSRIVDALGSHTVISQIMNMPVEKGLIVPLEHHFNEIYQPNIPNYSDLIEAVVKEVITLDEFKKNMAYLGYSEKWAEVIWDKHFTAPDFNAILNAFYRGIVSKEQLDELQILVDLDPRYKAIWDGLIEQIPPYSELVNELVKEVIDRDEFTYYMKWYGFDEKWAGRIWDAHFIAPSLGDLLTSWRRGLITESQLDDLMILVDLDPRFKEIFDTRKYNDPTIREGRYMFELGVINEATVKEIVELNGMNPEYVDYMVQYLTKFQERSEITGYLNALETAYTHGTITEDELRQATLNAGYTDEVADWKIKTAQVRRTYLGGAAKGSTEKLLSLGDIKTAYNYGVIGEDEFRTKLMLLGYELGEIDLLIRLEEEKRVQVEAGGRKEALTQSELVNAWRYGEVTEDYLRTQLMLRGLPESEINILIATKKAQWGVES